MKYFISFTLLVFINCNSKYVLKQKPNVILIMADDIGFECLSINGSTSYKTPVLDSFGVKWYKLHKSNFPASVHLQESKL